MPCYSRKTGVKISVAEETTPCNRFESASQTTLWLPLLDAASPPLSYSYKANWDVKFSPSSCWYNLVSEIPLEFLIILHPMGNRPWH